MPQSILPSSTLPATLSASTERTITTTGSSSSYPLSPVTTGNLNSFQPQPPILSSPSETSNPIISSPLTPSSALTAMFPLSPLTTLLVSSRRTPVHIHTSFLTAVSPFFRAALSPTHSFQEAQANTVTLEEESVATVSGFVRWCYSCAMNGEAANAGLWDWEKVDGPLERTKRWREERKEIRRTERERARQDAAAEQFDLEHTAEREDGHDEHEIAGNTTASSVANSNLALVAAVITSPYPSSTLLSPPPTPPSPFSPTSPTTTSGSFILPPRPQPPTFTPLLNLYIFADKYDVPLLRNQICARVVSVASEANAVPGEEDVELVWKNTLPAVAGEPEKRNRMRQLILDLYRGLNTRKLVEQMQEEEQSDTPEGHEDSVMVTFWRELVGEFLAAENDVGHVDVDANADGGQVTMLGKVRRPRGFYEEGSIGRI